MNGDVYKRQVVEAADGFTHRVNRIGERQQRVDVYKRQSSNSSIDQQTKDGRVSSDIMDTSGTEFRVAGIVDTGGSEDSIIYATNADVNKLTGITRGVDVIEYSAGASDLAGLVSSINDMTCRLYTSPRRP